MHKISSLFLLGIELFTCGISIIFSNQNPTYSVEQKTDYTNCFSVKMDANEIDTQTYLFPGSKPKTKKFQLSISSNFKRCYISNDQINSSCQQMIVDTNQTSNNEKDATLIKDWSKSFARNLNILDDKKINCGYFVPRFKLFNKVLWKHNEFLKKLASPVQIFFLKDKVSYTYDNIEEVSSNYKSMAIFKNCGEEFTNINFTFIDLPFVSNGDQNLALFSFHIFTLLSESNCQYNNELPLFCKYNFSDWLDIVGDKSSHELTIKFNDTFLKNALILDNEHNNIFNDFVTQNYDESTLNNIHALVNMNLIGKDNESDFKVQLNKQTEINWVNVYTWLLQHNSQLALKYTHQLGFNDYDNPLDVLNTLKYLTSFQLQYSISDINTPWIWNKYKKQINFSNLIDGLKIKLNPNENIQYGFKLDFISTNKVLNNQIFLAPQTINEFKHYSNIQKINDCYYLL